MKFLSVLMMAAMVLASSESWAAKRMGSGLSFGKQSSNVTQRNASPAQAPAQNSANNSATRPANAAAPAPAARPWGAMLGGLAAGLGLAWLASSLGLGEGFAQLLLILLAVAVAWMVISRLRRGAAAQRSPMAFEGAQPTPRNYSSYSPNNVGNDASARPWERTHTPFDASAQQGSSNGGSLIGSALSGPQTWGIPADFDTEGFLRTCKHHFVQMQAAWDRADIATLRNMLTDEMLHDIEQQLADRAPAAAGAVHSTEVVMLEAQLLGIEEQAQDYMASVEFSGMLREEPSAGPSPFREVWNLTKPKTGGGWRVAGLQQAM